LEVALAGESFWNWLDRAEERALRQQIRAFLDTLPAEQFPGEPDEFRRQCVLDLRAARKAGRLEAAPPDPRALAEETADLARFADPRAVLEAEGRLVQNIAEPLREAGHVHLARLLTLQPTPGQSLLALAARYFFRRAVEEDRTLFQGLMWASWEQLAEAQRRGFAHLLAALTEHGADLDGRLAELHAFLVQVHGALREIRQEQLRQGEGLRDLYEIVLDIQRRLDARPPQAQDALDLSPRDEDERKLLAEVLARHRALPAEQQRRMPALLQGAAYAQLRLGGGAAARQSFATLETFLTDPEALAEAHYHAYRAALRRQDWTRALASYEEAARLAPALWTGERLLSELRDVVPVDVLATVAAAAARLERR
jgi:hypothetical protein